MTSTYVSSARSQPASSRERARSAPPRTGPPGRRDSRRPGPGRGAPANAALRTAAQHSRAEVPHLWFAEQLLLVLSGRRPVHVLLGHVRGAAFDQLNRLAAGAPLCPRGADRTTPVLASVRGRQPRSGVVEAFARISAGGRDRAMAFRLEACPDRRWRCAAIELDGRPARR